MPLNIQFKAYCSMQHPGTVMHYAPKLYPSNETTTIIYRKQQAINNKLLKQFINTTKNTHRVRSTRPTFAYFFPFTCDYYDKRHFFLPLKISADTRHVLVFGFRHYIGRKASKQTLKSPAKHQLSLIFNTHGPLAISRHATQARF